MLAGTHEHSALCSGLWMQYDQLLNISAALTSPELWPMTWDREPDKPFSLRLPLSNHSSDTYDSCGLVFQLDYGRCRGFNMCKTLFLPSRALESKEETCTYERYMHPIGLCDIPQSPFLAVLLWWNTRNSGLFLFLSFLGCICPFGALQSLVSHVCGSACWGGSEENWQAVLSFPLVGSDTSCQVSR